MILPGMSNLSATVEFRKGWRNSDSLVHCEQRVSRTVQVGQERRHKAAGQLIGFALSLGMGAIGLLVLIQWRDTLMALMAHFKVYRFAVPVADKVLIVGAGLGLLVAVLFAHDWFADGFLKKRLLRRIARAGGVMILCAFGSALAMEIVLGFKGLVGLRLILFTGELLLGIALIAVSLIKQS